MLFNGFSPEAQHFLAELGQHNNKPWFENRRPDYEDLILIPLRKLVMDLSACMMEIDPEIELRPVVNKTISRIFRDTRYSKNKKPFRTNMWINFKHPLKEWHDLPSWWFEIKPDGYTYGMGFYQASPATMRRFRESIESNTARFREVISFYPGQPPFELEGALYKRPFQVSLPGELRTWHQRKNMYIICKRPSEPLLYSTDLVNELERRYREISPLYHYWLDISAARR